MFFSRADAVTRQESKCRLCQEAGQQSSPGICPTAVPWGQGTPPAPGVEGQQSSSGEPCRRGALIPLLFSSQATFDLLISRTDPVALRCLWGSEVQARGAEK